VVAESKLKEMAQNEQNTCGTNRLRKIKLSFESVAVFGSQPNFNVSMLQTKIFIKFDQLVFFYVHGTTWQL